MSQFPVIDVDPEWVIDDEPMGTKEKAWIELPGDSRPWLFKFSRVNDGVATGEHYCLPRLITLHPWDENSPTLVWLGGRMSHGVSNGMPSAPMEGSF
jgi:hypothetical protein